jgi:hypothetical protein
MGFLAFGTNPLHYLDFFAADVEVACGIGVRSMSRKVPWNHVFGPQEKA